MLLLLTFWHSTHCSLKCSLRCVRCGLEQSEDMERAVITLLLRGSVLFSSSFSETRDSALFPSLLTFKCVPLCSLLSIWLKKTMPQGHDRNPLWLQTPTAQWKEMKGKYTSKALSLSGKDGNRPTERHWVLMSHCSYSLSVSIRTAEILQGGSQLSAKEKSMRIKAATTCTRKWNLELEGGNRKLWSLLASWMQNVFCRMVWLVIPWWDGQPLDNMSRILPGCLAEARSHGRVSWSPQILPLGFLSFFHSWASLGLEATMSHRNQHNLDWNGFKSIIVYWYSKQNQTPISSLGSRRHDHTAELRYSGNMMSFVKKAEGNFHTCSAWCCSSVPCTCVVSSVTQWRLEINNEGSDWDTKTLLKSEPDDNNVLHMWFIHTNKIEDLDTLRKTPHNSSTHTHTHLLTHSAALTQLAGLLLYGAHGCMWYMIPVCDFTSLSGWRLYTMTKSLFSLVFFGTTHSLRPLLPVVKLNVHLSVLPF